MPKTIGIDARLWNETGVGRYIRNLVFNLEAIDKKNQYKLFVLKKDEKQISSQIKNKNFKIIIADVKWHSLKEQIIFPLILYREKLDLMHFTYFSFPIFYFKKYILTIHDLIPWKFPTGRASTLPIFLYLIKRFFYKFNLKIGAIFAQKIIAVSNSTKNEIEEYLTKNKIVVIKEGFDIKINDDNIKVDKKKGKYFLYVGNAYPHKNLNFLIDAFLKFSKIHSGYRLVLIGKSDFFYKKLEERLKKEDTLNINILHNISDAELSVFYKNAVALIMSSLIEGFGLPIVEAMSLGCPIIVSKIKVFEEICKDVPFYFNPKDEKDLLLVLNKFINVSQQDLDKRIEMGFKIVESFSWEAMANETLNVYNFIL